MQFSTSGAINVIIPTPPPTPDTSFDAKNSFFTDCLQQNLSEAMKKDEELYPGLVNTVTYKLTNVPTLDAVDLISEAITIYDSNADEPSDVVGREFIDNCK